MAQSYCSPYSKFIDLPICLTTLVIGTATAATDYYVYLRNITTGYLYRYEVTSDGAGLISLSIKDPDADGAAQFLPVPDHNYEMWITTQAATNTEANVSVTVNAIAYTGFAFSFFKVYETGTDLAAYTTQTLKLEA